ncbi:protein TolQ [Asticcacaulis machinosus]|uniref:Protein TolQ n=1 Tax=Asticcacaulis machinosus TaxID=2984211 RepID=A0ABT5HMT1_9CAUL|nr:protein TolQ [Asticcacaulis machinosus]MDC7677554.1 protein TolQ [Asticcacaulis machinosus]
MEAAAAPEALSSGLNFVELFMQADWVVKSVMIGLVLASLWSWAIIIDKTLKLNRMNKEADGFEGTLASGRPLEDIGASLGTNPTQPFQKLLVAVTAAWRDYKGKVITPSQSDLLVNQIDRELNHVISAEADQIEDGLSILAVIATASPFIGLFGTVWGIMNAFGAIASQGDTNLATVAPAISEALFATAMGLAAAIPAYIGYNLFSAKTGRFVGRMEGFADELMVSVTRRLADKLGGLK